MISELLIAAPPSTNPPDYIPAIIGLGGVVVGGIIQVIAQRRLESEKQIARIRSDCAELATAAGNYSSVMAQMVRVVAPVLNDFRAASKKDKDAQLDAFIDEDFWKRLGESLVANFATVYESSLSVAASKDHRVADQAMKVHHACTDAHNEAAPLMTGEVDITKERADTLSKEIRLEASILLGMVEPRPVEMFLRFRRPGTAHRQLKNLRKKEAKAKAEAATGQ